MEFSLLASLFTLTDWLALALIIAASVGVGYLIEHPPASRPSVTSLMAAFRYDWMAEFVTRQPRIFDAQILSNLRQGTSFFASTTILAIGGVLALMGNAAELEMLSEDLGADVVTSATALRLKLLLVILFLANGFLKFVWSHRVFGYCAVMMASVPNDVDHPRTDARARQAAALNIRAALNFNRGLRALYFAMASLAWLAGPYALTTAAFVTIWVLWSREFASVPRRIILQDAATSTQETSR